MITYVAFLRGINVGGRKIIKMEDLSRMFVSMGFRNVKTYIQSGNVIFETAEINSNVLTKKIEKELHKSLGYEVRVFLRTILEVEDIVQHNPFKGMAANANVGMYVTFLSEEPKSKPELPLVSPQKDVEVFRIRKREAFILCRKIKGRSGFPNNFIEKELGMPATTRNWTTISKIIIQTLPKPGR